MSTYAPKPPGLMRDAPGGRKRPALPPRTVSREMALFAFLAFVGVTTIVAQLTPFESVARFHSSHKMPLRATTHQNKFTNAKERMRPYYRPPTMFMYRIWIIVWAVAAVGLHRRRHLDVRTRDAHAQRTRNVHLRRAR